MPFYRCKNTIKSFQLIHEPTDWVTLWTTNARIAYVLDFLHFFHSTEYANFNFLAIGGRLLQQNSHN